MSLQRLSWSMLVNQTDELRLRVAELLEEVRRAHGEIDEWKRCAVDWMRRCGELEAKLGEAEHGVGILEIQHIRELHNIP